MFQKLFCSLIVMSASIGLVAAEDFRCTIKKVDGKNITFAKFSKDKDKKAEDMTLPAAEGVKVTKGTRDFKSKETKVGDAVEGGLSNEMFKKIDEKKGLFAELRTSDDGKSITHVILLTFGKKDKKTTDK